MCAKTMTLGNYAEWIDVLMHIHISPMGKSVIVKDVSQLTYLHIATSYLLFWVFQLDRVRRATKSMQLFMVG